MFPRPDCIIFVMRACVHAPRLFYFMELFADIVLPVAHAPFTFLVPAAETGKIAPGVGVEVRVGARRRYMGIVWRLHAERPEFRVRPLERVMTERPLLDGRQMELWEWVASYYMCTLGEVMRFALPAALKPHGVTDEEFAAARYAPATVRCVRVVPGTDVSAARESLKRSRVQLAAFETLLAADGPVPRRGLGVSAAVLARLEEKGIAETVECETASMAGGRDVPPAGLAALTVEQKLALAEVESSFRAGFGTVLLHGVTGSGKTEIYFHMIARVLAAGGSVLYLVPEIAMTSQLVARVRAVFGSRAVVYHSALTDRRRAETYRRLSSSGGGELVVGVRSSIFLPLPKLGLVIVDEEHDPGYKQPEPAPRYNARDCAVWMARNAGARCLLASATPSIESWTNAVGGKYALVSLPQRYGEGRLPAVTVSDSGRARRRGERRMHFDKALMDRMKDALDRGRQVMLFQNRRGLAPWVECETCGWTARCPRCSVTLTHHREGGDRLRCHVCGYSMAVPAVCPECGGAPRACGFGTEKVEEEVAALFPSARVLRLDRDAAASPSNFERIVSDFGAGKADVLVGTQLITKGFDFGGVSLVGVMNADSLLNFPDFRASERAFQMLTQVAGRAGRTDGCGEVVIQTTRPDDATIRQVQAGDYEEMVASQLAERSAFGYPPYGKLIRVVMRHRDEMLVEEAGAWLAARMREALGERVFGPHPPVLERAGGECYREILLKIGAGESAASVKKTLSELLGRASREARFRSVFIFCDVDPQ